MSMDKANLLDEPSDLSPSSVNPVDGNQVSKDATGQDGKKTSSWKSFFRRSSINGNKSNYVSQADEPNTQKTPENLDLPKLRPTDSDSELSQVSTNPDFSDTNPPANGLSRISIDTEHSQLLKRADERQLSNWQAVLHLFKVFTGPSTVGMPAIIRNGGILFGALGFLCIGFLNTYASVTIVKCGRILCRRTGISALRYEELMELSVHSYSSSPKGMRMARVMRNLTVAMLWLTQFGILALYIQVIGAVFHMEIRRVWPSYMLPLMMTEFFVMLCLIPYSLMTNLRILSWFSLLANVFIGVCVITMVQFSFRHLEPISELPLISPDPWTILLFLGASVFTVEGVPMVLPIENRVRHPKDYGGCCGVVTVAATMNITINLALGFFGYLSMADKVPANFLLALPNFWWYRVISLLYAMMVFLTFTLQLFLPAEFVVTALHERFPNESLKTYGHVIVRICIVVLAYLFAALIPNIELVMSLTGSSSSVTLLFLLPPVAEMLLKSGEPEGLTKYVLIRSILCMLFGCVIFVSGTYASVMTIVQKLSGSS